MLFWRRNVYFVAYIEQYKEEGMAERNKSRSANDGRTKSLPSSQIGENIYDAFKKGRRAAGRV